MKKSVIALAVFAVSGAALAQSNVTLYGIVDVFVGSNELQVNGVGQRQTVVDTSGVGGSRWGMKGSEDLGKGLKAIFQLESGFDTSTGASGQGGLLFGRQAFVGITGDFGAVTLGRQYTSYDYLHAVTNQNGQNYTFNAATGLAGGRPVGVSMNGLADYAGRLNNSIAYRSPVFSGFSGSVAYSFGENKNAVSGQEATDAASLHIKYVNGPLLIGYAYQEEKQPVVAGVQDKRKYNLIGGTYNFGVAKLNAFYNQAKSNVFKDYEYSVGADIPFGAVTVSAGYAHSKSEGLGVERKGDGYSIVAMYALTKRTGLYAGAQSTKAFVLNSVNETKSTVYGLGIKHTF